MSVQLYCVGKILPLFKQCVINKLEKKPVVLAFNTGKWHISIRVHFSREWSMFYQCATPSKFYIKHYVNMHVNHLIQDTFGINSTKIQNPLI